MKTKDYIIKALIWLIWVALVAYVAWLYTQGAQVMSEGWESNNMIGLIFAWVIGLFLILAASKESVLPNNRRGVLLLWIGVIWSAHAYLADIPSSMVYLQDIMKLVGVVLCIAWPTKALQSAKYEEQKLEEEIEVIEV